MSRANSSSLLFPLASSSSSVAWQHVFRTARHQHHALHHPNPATDPLLRPEAIQGSCFDEKHQFFFIITNNFTRQVFGAGLSKTGTTSLGAALSALGYECELEYYSVLSLTHHSYRNIHTDFSFTPYLFPPGQVCTPPPHNHCSSQRPLV